jgi:hypothetical protein
VSDNVEKRFETNIYIYIYGTYDSRKRKRARGTPEKNWMENIRKAMNERILSEGQWAS